MTIRFGMVLEQCVEYYSIYSDMTERVILGCRRFLNKKITFTVPEYNIRTGPANADIFPVSCCQRCFNIVVKCTIDPLTMWFTRRVWINSLIIEKNITAGSGILHNE